MSMDCSSMASIATYNPGDPGLSPTWFAISNSNRKLSVKNKTSMWYSSKQCNPARGETLIDGDKQPLKEALANLETIYRCSEYSTGLSELLWLMVPVPDSSHWVDQNIAKQRRTIKTLKLITALFVLRRTHYM